MYGEFSELVIKNLGLKDNIDAVYNGSYIELRKDGKCNKGIRLRFLYNHNSEGKEAKIIVRYYGSLEVYACRNQVCKVLYKNFDKLDLNDTIISLRSRKELKSYIK